MGLTVVCAGSDDLTGVVYAVGRVQLPAGTDRDEAVQIRHGPVRPEERATS